jgi:hypothetical protein
MIISSAFLSVYTVFQQELGFVVWEYNFLSTCQPTTEGDNSAMYEPRTKTH